MTTSNQNLINGSRTRSITCIRSQARSLIHSLLDAKRDLSAHDPRYAKFNELIVRLNVLASEADTIEDNLREVLNQKPREN